MNEMIKYLADGGLIEILKHPSIGKKPPRVWLYQKEDGQWSHTFSREIANSDTEGSLIPVSCLDGESLFEPKKDEILSFLQNIGLSPRDAEYVYCSVMRK